MKTTQYKCKAVVVGTGAGGAVAGATLAEAGVDTIILEEGKYYKPADHTSVFDGFVNMYLGGGATLAFGRPPISLTVGRAVGGTTIINSSTCFRPPKEKVASWGGQSYDEMLPFIEEIERRINAKPADIELLGGNWNVLKRGCDKIGVELKPLVHNIRDCAKRGRCAFGCPEGAKQSTEIAFIPQAVEKGARLLAGHFVDGVIMENGRAAGVRGSCEGCRFEVRADAVVLSMGAMRTPAFLMKRKLANSSRRVGRGLQIHPAARVVAEMNEIVDGHIGISQGAFVDHWADRGVMLEGIFLHPGIMAPSLPGVGRELKEICASYRKLSAFGAMVSDTSVGRIFPSSIGDPYFALYMLNQADALSLRFGIARIAEIYLEAGAKRVFTSFHPVPIVDSRDSLKRLETAKCSPRDMEAMAFHPLGTCGMGADPRKSVVDFALETHDVKNLYVMDASVIPGSLGVNPQITIMSLTLRAARQLAGKLK
jgi:choline dehydrogenase-like flavoprotein